MTVIRLIKANVLPAKQCCPGAPYVILREDLESSTIRRAVESGRAVSHDSRQKVMEYDDMVKGCIMSSERMGSEKAWTSCPAFARRAPVASRNAKSS